MAAGSLLLGLILAYPVRKYGRRFWQKDMGLKPLESMDDPAFRTLWDDILAGRPGTAMMKQLTRKPILYLQGHAREGEGRVYQGGVPMRIQFFLSGAFLQRHTQMLGIGGRDSEVVKLSRDDDQWESTFHQLADWLNVIVMRPFHTPGVLKELRYLLDHSPEKLIVIMDPVDTNFDGKVTSQEERESQFRHGKEWLDSSVVWARVRAMVADQLPLPAYDPAGGFIGFTRQADATLQVDHRPFLADAIVELVEERNGFVQRYAHVDFRNLNPEGQASEASHTFPIYERTVTPADIENKARDAMTSMLEEISGMGGWRCEAQFARWISVEDYQSALQAEMNAA